MSTNVSAEHRERILAHMEKQVATIDGGSAFPVGSGYRVGDREKLDFSGGMSLRDYFAAKAMQALLSNDKPVSIVPDFFHNEARTCYALADAMLKAREQ